MTELGFHDDDKAMSDNASVHDSNEQLPMDGIGLAEEVQGVDKDETQYYDG